MLPVHDNTYRVEIKNFTKNEMACKCGCGFVELDDRLLIGLQFVSYNRNEAVHVLSGCRCPEHNKNESGSSKSQHMKGKACDIAFSMNWNNERSEETFKFLIGCKMFSTIIWYKSRGFFHVDVRDRKNQISHWIVD